ncbi:hypothetical protein [Longimicrobium sp.]|jgi:hypothetical protein|uniref:hypothetical protein n=1 Tax=Longimicrobium sp. TaxID=2029185 RepID=UPI002EDA03D2
MKRPILAALAAAVAASACNDMAVNAVCPDVASPAVLIRVVDGPTQQRVDMQVTGRWETGTLGDSLRHLGAGSERYLAAIGPAGTYTVTVGRPGSAVWTRSGIVVPGATCGPQTQELTATLQPG